MTTNSLVDIIDHLLNRGTVLLGRSTISVAEVDLVDLELQIVLSSIETLGHARQGLAPGTSVIPGIEQDPAPQTPPSPAPGIPRAAWAEPSPTTSDRHPARSNLDDVRTLPPEAGEETGSAEGHREAALEKRPLALPNRGGDGEPPERGLARLALTVVEILRQVVERQAVRRMDGGSLDEADVERMGVALMELERKMAEIRDIFGLEQRDLDLELGPLDGLFK